MFRKYENKQNITKMKFEVPVVCYCTLGDNYYKPILNIEIGLSSKIVDFLDLEVFFKKELNGAKYTSEELVGKVFDTMKEIYNPKYLFVQVSSDSHFSIKTIKEEYFE